MLVLTRREGEVVQVGDGAVIVLDARPGQVKLGFVFPGTVHIMRSEVADEVSDAARACTSKFRRQQEDIADRRADWLARHRG